MKGILEIIDDYEELCSNFLLSGSDGADVVNIDELKKLVEQSINYHLEYGASIINKLVEIYEKEAYGLDNKDKIKEIFKFFAYTERLKEEYQKKILFDSIE